MAKDISGTPQGITLNGVGYDVTADANFKIVVSQYATESQPTSGRNFFQKKRQSMDIDDVPIKANFDELQTLKALAESLTDFTMAAKFIDGTVYRTTGMIALNEWTAEDAVAKIKMMPRTKWEPFVSP